MAGLDIKSLGNPDEVRPFADEKGAAHIVNCQHLCNPGGVIVLRSAGDVASVRVGE